MLYRKNGGGGGNAGKLDKKTLGNEAVGVATAALTIGVAVLLSLAKPGLEVTVPITGTLVNPGQKLGVNVSTSNSYAQVIIAGSGPIGFSQPLTSPPFRFTIQIPAKITPGFYTLRAVGGSASGQLDYSDPISIDVERSDPPISLKIEPERLDMSVRQKTLLDVVGTYKDGTVADLSKSSLTTYVSKSPDIVTVSGDGLVTAVAPGTTKIIINGTFEIMVTVSNKRDK